MNRHEIQEQLRSGYTAVIGHIKGKDSRTLDRNAHGKWSLAENCIHLVKSVAPINTAMMLPRFALRMFGTADSSRSFDAVVVSYQDALAHGAKATGSYIPHAKGTADSEDLANKLTRHHERLIQHLDKWNETDLDRYRLPHPIIGKLTVREMLYFTIYHIGHHEQVMSKFD